MSRHHSFHVLLPFRLTALLLAGVLAALAATLSLPSGSAHATAPIDHRSTQPNHSSELPGAGFLLTDPYQGPSQAYWAGAYRSVPGERSYCLDDYYDYPNPAYGYRAPEVSGWPGRPGSNLGAQGHTAQRIIWIVNSYGASSSPVTDAAVSMAINLLTGSQPFNRSYYGYFRQQLAAIDGRIVPLIERMVSDSDRYAGPYRTEVRFGAPPPLGHTGRITVLVRSARGFSVPGASYAITGYSGFRLQSPRIGRTGPNGVAGLSYLAMHSGLLRVTAQGIDLPNTTMRLGYSPSHNTNSFGSGSQRVALVSAHRLVSVAPGAASATVSAPAVRTVVDTGSAPHHVGDRVRDHLLAHGLARHGRYQLTVRLVDEDGRTCGTARSVVTANARGLLDLHTSALPVCGGGWNTFTERLSYGPTTVASSPPQQPTETFPVAPTVTTAVTGGVQQRRIGEPVADRVRISGLRAGQTVRVEARLLDDRGTLCGQQAVTLQADRAGELDYTTTELPACGTGRDTFVERVVNTSGHVIAATAPWLRTETFPLVPPVVQKPVTPPTVTPKPTPTVTPTAGPPSAPAPVPSPEHTAPPTPAAHPVSRTVAAPSTPAHLAFTGSTPRVALVAGLLAVSLGGLVLLGLRRQP